MSNDRSPFETRWEQAFIPEPMSGCWLWIRGGRNGYGAITYQGTQQDAHRVSYQIHRGPIPEGLVVRHRCDIRYCVNPDHLELGTKADNNGDTKRRGRHWADKITHCHRGHEFTPENTYRSKSGCRNCRQCKKIYQRTYRERIGR